MARIIHIEDEDEWIQHMRRALADHQVDSARTYEEALSLISGNAPYDLALVDLHLGESNDLLGGEVLDLLKADYPATPRIVITGSPPPGGMGANILRRYMAVELIIKGTTTLPDLRRAVAEALAHDPVPAAGEPARGGTERHVSTAGRRASSARPGEADRDQKAVMVIYGHDEEANVALFDWLRAVGLIPQEWTELVRKAGTISPYMSQVLDQAFTTVQAVIAFFTPDEYVTGVTTPPSRPPAWRLQARPNVLFEAGMAFATHPDRTVLVLLGSQELPSDISGRNFVQLDGTARSLHELANRLQYAGCEVDRSGSDWLNPARFPNRDDIPSSPAGGGAHLQTGG